MPKNSRSARLRRTIAVVSAGSLLFLAACSGDDPASPESSEADKLRGAGTLTKMWPLTGGPADGPAPDHPVMVVKIDNTSSSQPQIGLSSADLITEELVEGGSTRLAVFYYSQVPDLVGPVRSMRATDIGVITPARAVLVASGGAPKTVKLFKKADITTYTEGAPGYERDDSRVAPYDLMMRLPQLVETLGSGDVPTPYLPFGEPQLRGAKPANEFEAAFSGGSTTQWQFKPGTGWVRPGSYADPKDDFVADNVLVLRVKVGDAGYKDPAGNPVPKTIFTGKGAAMLFTDGKMVSGTWSKANDAAVLQLTTRSGDVLSIPPGHTWIELVPKSGGSVKISKK